MRNVYIYLFLVKKLNRVSPQRDARRAVVEFIEVYQKARTVCRFLGRNEITVAQLN